MKKTSETIDNRRRQVLTLAATAAPVVAAATALGATAATADEAAPKSSGLQDTAQTRAYYQTARF